MAFNPSPRQFKALKAALFVLALLPFLRMAWLTAAGVPVDPVEFLTHGSGDWALYLLCATLAITPLRRLTGWNWVVRLRRMAGLFTFFYAFMHFMTFLWFDHFFDVAAMWKDVLKRPFITVGFAAFVLLIPLAVTSTNAMIRRLGRNWALLHKAIYVIAPLAILHYWWMKAGKHNFEQPIVWGSVVGVLLLLRVWWSLSRTRAEKRITPASVRS
ncbi:MULTISPECIES: protein-methionine-sulfoxide reductase heme-binding subunit MsrQ [Massilia]|jgi:sulfoxide reductase heme-binding subunit YedZ|uniref:Protein-methionine-sulfoxide reductase heme-binding subunit MsrQ n=2 Tax=Massilia TaxID=149698 RepID=A0A7X3FVG7_9BURK|nr:MULTISPECIES: protein-methionine-sulfoxide reductase heme-binding subunit MsrQ [Telluria group]KQY13501.1 sulfite oxidase [Massilia sp. Root133]KQZ47626.1 sulfite oxidase [Massilia sp. Root1485]MDN4044350.1 protein-methionine-sulfoxide reductase heme-binding subunit MsrQ [Massilia sp. YIM B02787]MVW58615.1 sulfoxide reductase heme-binding subunit YedZ [Telluria cellulosilytica]